MNNTLQKFIRRIKHTAVQLVRDECGTASWVSMIVGTVVFSLGAIVGLATLRDHLVQEFGDFAVALDHLDQSWAYDNGIDRNGDGDYTDPGECVFQAQFVDTSTLNDPAGDAPANITFGP